MSLRDYYHEKRGSKVQAAEGDSTPILLANLKSDAWTLAYLDVQWLQPIRESFDDDASGYVTVNEVNTFTNARPLNWR
jgi:hypothetical protein